MADLIDKQIVNKKAELLDYYRNRAKEFITEIKQRYADTEYKLRAGAINQALTEAKGTLIKAFDQKAKNENWTPQEILEAVLTVTYTNYVVMIESRHELWPYEYMTFARRIGELWEPFCQLCWKYPINKNISYFVPPLFKEVREKLSKELEDFILKLNISEKEREELRNYYKKVWTLVVSGEINLELDLHFKDKTNKYVVDFKSGFSSNEKGNTNRLLLVASVYKILDEGHKCLLFCRSAEEQNNHYLQTLKKSGLWTVFCGKESYEQIGKLTGFDLGKWMEKNVNWEKDFDLKMYTFLKKNHLIQYLEW